jgi:hypothetical protein
LAHSLPSSSQVLPWGGLFVPAATACPGACTNPDLAPLTPVHRNPTVPFCLPLPSFLQFSFSFPPHQDTLLTNTVLTVAFCNRPFSFQTSVILYRDIFCGIDFRSFCSTCPYRICTAHNTYKRTPSTRVTLAHCISLEEALIA